MLGENVDTSKASPDLIQAMFKVCQDTEKFHAPLSIAIFGESGSGKSVIGKALYQKANQEGVECFLLQMDNYFKLPPRSNSKRRQESLAHVGPEEVDLAYMEHNLESLLKGERNVQKPLMDFQKNLKMSEVLSASENLRWIISEGTYTGLLQNTHLTFFCERNYKETHIHRVVRMREPQTDLIEKVLEIEHRIVSSLRYKADYIITREFQLEKNCK